MFSVVGSYSIVGQEQWIVDRSDIAGHDIVRFIFWGESNVVVFVSCELPQDGKIETMLSHDAVSVT